jgi:hypothetical protein
MNKMKVSLNYQFDPLAADGSAGGAAPSRTIKRDQVEAVAVLGQNGTERT